jgi:hypothetical protein
MTESYFLDRSTNADATRFRWMLMHNGYFLEEAGLCNGGGTATERDEARRAIDKAMKAKAKEQALEQALRHIATIRDNWALLDDPGCVAMPSLTGQITFKQLQDISLALEAQP